MCFPPSCPHRSTGQPWVRCLKFRQQQQQACVFAQQPWRAAAARRQAAAAVAPRRQAAAPVAAACSTRPRRSCATRPTPGCRPPLSRLASPAGAPAVGGQTMSVVQIVRKQQQHQHQHHLCTYCSQRLTARKPLPTRHARASLTPSAQVAHPRNCGHRRPVGRQELAAGGVPGLPLQRARGGDGNAQVCGTASATGVCARVSLAVCVRLLCVCACCACVFAVCVCMLSVLLQRTA